MHKLIGAVNFLCGKVPVCVRALGGLPFHAGVPSGRVVDDRTMCHMVREPINQSINGRRCWAGEKVFTAGCEKCCVRCRHRKGNCADRLLAIHKLNCVRQTHQHHRFLPPIIPSSNIIFLYYIFFICNRCFNIPSLEYYSFGKKSTPCNEYNF